MDLTRFYRPCLWLYPKDQREQFGAEMESVFGQAAEERRGRGRAAYARFAIGELAGLLAGACGSRFAWLARQSPADRVITAPVVFPNDVREMERIVQVSIDRMVYAIAKNQFTQARFYSLVERQARARLDAMRGGASASE